MEYVIVCMVNPWKILSISTGILTGFGGVTPPGICRGKWSRQINWGHQSGQSGTSSIVSLPFATNVSVPFVKTKMLGQLHALRQFNLYQAGSSGRLGRRWKSLLVSSLRQSFMSALNDLPDLIASAQVSQAIFRA